MTVPRLRFPRAKAPLPHQEGEVSYVKGDLHGSRTSAVEAEAMSAIVQACKEIRPEVTVVAAGYADYARFGGLSPLPPRTWPPRWPSAPRGCGPVCGSPRRRRGSSECTCQELLEVGAADRAGVGVWVGQDCLHDRG
ncbi:(5-formylfuran-3-yl)methyl phosphate synthase [Streptomyces sp. NBC_00690]|uniref:(5-formylfuran-3-yl)methyl phosphate synthase n=1 Tax=Streptomyces sp. NBC_00690 TaxID=2975808 RepID=UPI003FA6E0B4